MPPLNLSMIAGTIRRPTDYQEQKEVYKQYIFVCEGEVTEKNYFDAFKKNKAALGIDPNIEIYSIDKYGKHLHTSYPPTLFELIKEAKREIVNDGKFDEDIDKIVFVFDLDIYYQTEQNPTRMDEILNQTDSSIILGVTNPNFELFLLLHRENAYNDLIQPNYNELVNNNWIGTGKHKRRPTTKLFMDTFEFDSKKGSNKDFFNQLVLNVELAIEEEKKINQSLDHWQGKLTSNIGRIIESIINEKVY